MKKFLCFLLSVLTAASLLAPTASAGTASASEEYSAGRVLFSEDFSDVTKFNALTSTPNAKTGYYIVGNDHANCKLSACKEIGTVIQSTASKTGKLIIDSSSVPVGYTARVLMYDMTDENVDKFTVVFDFKVIDFDEGGSANAVGLVISDNGMESDHSNNTKDAAFQPFLLKTGNRASQISCVGLTASSDGDTSYNSSGPSSSKNLGLDNTSYKIVVSVDTTDTDGDNSTVTMYREGVQVYSDTFVYAATSKEIIQKYQNTTVPVKKQIGFIANGVDVELDQLNVYYGTREAEYTETGVSVGSDIALTYSAKINNEAVKTAGLTTKFFRDGNLIEEVAAEYKDDTTALFKFEGIAPNQMDEEIIAELWSGGVMLDTRTYSVKQNLEALIASDNPNVTDTHKTFAKDALVYGGAAQAYKGETDTINNGKYTSSVTTKPQGDALDLSNNKNGRIMSAGLRFGYKNRIFFKINAIENVDVKILVGENEVKTTKDGNKVYTDYIAASELGTDFTVNVYVGGALESTLTYSVYDYIANKWNSATIGNLAKALYSYAKSAEALA